MPFMITVSKLVDRAGVAERCRFLGSDQKRKEEIDLREKY